MGERLPDSLMAELVLTTDDSLENARKAKEGIEKKFPDVGFKIVTNPADISVITPKPIENGNVLIQITIPREKRANTADLLKTWADSLK